MKRFGMIGLVFVGFVAGMFYVYACGGGGSSAFAEITDVSGIEARLDEINTSIQAIGGTFESQILTVTSLGNGSSFDFPDIIDTTDYTDVNVYCSNSIGGPSAIEYEMRQYINGMFRHNESHLGDTDFGPFPVQGNEITLSVHNDFGGTVDISCMVQLRR